MDVSFSAKPRRLSVTSFPSGSSSSSLLSPARITPLRREFLGCGHNLRPPGLRSQRKCRKLGIQIRSPRFFFRASLESSLLVVTVVTVSALTFVYLDYSKRKKKKKDVGEVSGPLFLVISQRVRGFMNQYLKNWWLDLALEPVSANGSRYVVNEMRESKVEEEDELIPCQLMETAVKHEETLITTTVESSGFSIITSCVSGSVPSENLKFQRHHGIE